MPSVRFDRLAHALAGHGACTPICVLAKTESLGAASSERDASCCTNTAFQMGSFGALFLGFSSCEWRGCRAAPARAPASHNP